MIHQHYLSIPLDLFAITLAQSRYYSDSFIDIYIIFVFQIDIIVLILKYE